MCNIIFGVNNLRRASLLIFAVCLTSLGAAAISQFDVTSPKDKTITWSTRLFIEGSAPKAKQIDINGAAADLERTGNFSAMALLNPGKNVILVKAIYPEGKTSLMKVRILRKVASDDISSTVKGRQHWARTQILTLLTLGIIENYPDNLFQPQRSLSRGEFATWLARAKELRTFRQKKDVFYDVPKEQWRAPYIKAVVDRGYMKGIKNNRFGLDEKISRVDAVIAAAKANGLEPLKLSKSPFSDVKPSSEGAYYIFSAHKNGWVIGVSGKGKRFEPNKDMTRGEIAVLLSRLSNIKKLRASINDFNVGYTDDRLSGISTRPYIVESSSNPDRIVAGRKTEVKISAKVSDSQGPSDIFLVWADLTPLGGPGNAIMNLMKNGKFEVTITLTGEAQPGEKNITIGALDRSGLKSKTSTVRITVLKANK
jgi:hypothetical protein